MKKLKESLVYPTMSFISELGGSLGLFVGFSILTIWDYFNVVLNKIQNSTFKEIYKLGSTSINILLCPRKSFSETYLYGLISLVVLTKDLQNCETHS